MQPYNCNKLNDLIKISVIIGILLISGSISYYFIYFLPNHEKSKTILAEQKELLIMQKENERKIDLEGCLNAANANYRILLKVNSTGNNFSMPLELAETLDKRHKDEKDGCYKQFPPVKQ
ncbi:MAG: hypothetical protein A2511_17555 [Deltaproteobacteria bacterium RIFOXYD12_FULL_50_9]|nr:MAG: hypothetical protein A2511_17555 [Deltaproteobacteria bacterium RIFOXYD12_FULL_50_9]